jgi:hypothetical protein
MADARTRHFRRLGRLRAGARRWSALAASFAGAAAVLTPYQGIGLPDAGWAAAAGGALALAVWRWSDHRALAAQPAPPPPDPAETQRRLVAAIERFPAGRTAIEELRRQRNRYALRGSSVAGPWGRLDRAAATLAGLAGRLVGPGEPALLEAAVAEESLRDLGQRVASVERAVQFAPAEQRAALMQAHQNLSAHFQNGVAAYERLVAAAASFVAEDGRPIIDPHPAVARLTEAADMLRGVAEGLAELRGVGRIPSAG